MSDQGEMESDVLELQRLADAPPDHASRVIQLADLPFIRDEELTD